MYVICPQENIPFFPAGAAICADARQHVQPGAVVWCEITGVGPGGQARALTAQALDQRGKDQQRADNSYVGRPDFPKQAVFGVRPAGFDLL